MASKGGETGFSLHDALAQSHQKAIDTSLKEALISPLYLSVWTGTGAICTN